ncbi:MAG: acetylornithine aminotransferase [Vezdaea aestivalis]|nr:MAG: acetylornithine aminotransferase [Vezdaea aestivalis]
MRAFAMAFVAPSISSLSARRLIVASIKCPRKRYSTRATSAATASSLPEELKQDIAVFVPPRRHISIENADFQKREWSLPSPDPAADSATAALISEQAPYMVKTYVRPMPMFVRGEGCYMWDVENRKYLDFTAGIAVTALGHSDPELARLIAHQTKTLLHTSNLYHNPWTGALSRLLVSKTLAHDGMHDAAASFICNSGSEANEAALKFARKYGKTIDSSGAKNKILSFHGSFHGRTMGSLSATPNPKYQIPFSPMIPGFHYGTLNDIASLDSLIDSETAGIIIEPIQAEGGINIASPEFLARIRELCNQHDAVLIYDEIQCGLSRTGKLWAHSHLPASSHPDIISTAKALGNGFPIGATIVNKRVADAIVTGDHGTTFGGNPLACRVGHAILERLTNPVLMEGVTKKNAWFRAKFEEWMKRWPDVVTEFRGKGLILGLQLSQDPVSVVTAARERGLLVITCGTNTLRFVPPLVITEGEIREGLAILEDSMISVLGQGR